MELSYKRRNKIELFTKGFQESDPTVITNILNQIINQNSTNQIDYILLYNNLFLLNDFQKFKEIVDNISKMFKKKLEVITDSIYKLSTPEEKLNALFSGIEEINKKTDIIRTIILTNKLRFDTEMTKYFNTYINLKVILKEFEDKNAELYEKIINFCVSLSNEKGKLLHYLGLVQKSCSSKINQQIMSTFFESKITYYKNEVNNKNINSTEILQEYFTKFSKKIDEESYFFSLLFGDQEASTLKEKLIEIVFLNKLSNNIFNNEEFLEKMLNEKDFVSLKNIEKLSRRKTHSMKTFQNLFFDFYYKYFTKKIKIPKTGAGIKEGLQYINELIEYISQLIGIFQDVFKFSRQVQLKYNETLIKMTNSNKIPHFEVLLSIFINENLYKNEKIIYSPPLSIILRNLNGKEIFFSNFLKLTLRRISSFKFIIEKEEKFINYLRENFEIKYLHKFTRIIKDIKENITLSNDLTKFFLLSFDSLSKNEVSQIIQMKNEHTFDKMLQDYKTNYPHRIITISQIFTTAQITFNKKNELIVNYVQAKVLNLFNSKRKIAYEEILTLINADIKYITLFRGCIMALIQSKILKKDEKSSGNDLLKTDILEPNFDLVCTNNKILNCFEKTLLILNKEIYCINNTKSSTDNNEGLGTSSNYNQNARFIIECKIVKTVKQSNNNTILETDLMRCLLMDEQIKDLFTNNVDIVLIKRLIEGLIQRGFISQSSLEGKISYKFTS